MVWVVSWNNENLESISFFFDDIILPEEICGVDQKICES